MIICNNSILSVAEQFFIAVLRCLPCINEPESVPEVSDFRDMRGASWTAYLIPYRIGELGQRNKLVEWVENAPSAVEREVRSALSGRIRFTNFGAVLNVYGLNLRVISDLTLPVSHLYVQGDLDLSDCRSLVCLPENLRVEGGLDLSYCTSLIGLPENLQVGGYLSLIGCTRLTRVPGNLQVASDLFLCGCTSLIDISDNIQTGGSLNLSGCTRLTHLPENIRVGWNLNLNGCTQLTALPNWVSQLRNRGNTGWSRQVNLTNTGLSEAILERLLALNLPGVRFIFGLRVREYQEYGTLQEAILSWKSEGVSATYPSDNWHLNQDQTYQLKTFLYRLHQTAEALNRNTVNNLRHRVHAFLRHMNDNLRDYRTQALERISHGLESCDDRVILIMNQIELLIRIREAERAQNPEVALRDLGRGLLALEVVHRYAAAKCERTFFVDPVEVYLALEIHLNQEFHLPLSTQNMLFERCAQLTGPEIDAARQEVRATLADSVRIDHFMNQWEPWQRYQRVVQSEQLTWDELLPSVQKFKSDDSCVITGDGLEKLGDPISVGNSLYSLGAFKRWWIEQGTNPVTRTPVSLGDIRKVLI